MKGSKTLKEHKSYSSESHYFSAEYSIFRLEDGGALQLVSVGEQTTFINKSDALSWLAENRENNVRYYIMEEVVYLDV